MKYNSVPVVFNVVLNVRGGTPLERDVEYEGKHYINSEVTDLIKELDFTFYSDIILSMQGQDDIATMTPVQRANLLQRLFQFDFAEKVKGINDKIDEANEAIKLDNSKIDYLNKELVAKKARRDSVVLKEPPFDSSTYYAKQAEQDRLFEELSNTKKIMGEVNELHDKRNDIVEKSNNLGYKIQDLKQRKETAQAAKNELETFDFDGKSSTLTSEIENLRKEIDSQNASLQMFDESIKAFQTKQTEVLQNIATCQYKDTEFAKKLSLIEKGVCPECGQSTCNMDHSVIEYDKDTNANKIIDLKAEEGNIGFAIADDKRKKEEIRQKISSLISKKATAEANLTSLRSTYNVLKAKVMPLDVYEQLESDLTVAEADQSALQDAYNNVMNELEKRKDAWIKQDEIERKYEAIKADIKMFDNAMVFNNAAQKQIEQYDEDIKNSELNIEEIKNNAASLAKDIDCYNEVKKVLDKELPNFLIVKTCSKLETEMNTFVQEVFPEFRIRLLQSKRGVEFFYTTDPNNDMEDVKSLINSKMASGYERSVLGIAFKVALCRAYGLTFAALDEIDAAASDDNSMKTFSSLINSNVFDQMIFITHKEPTKEMIRSLADDVTCYHVESGEFTNETVEN
jgi:chromosome segregation ATPase